VNICVGVWWTLSFLISLYQTLHLPQRHASDAAVNFLAGGESVLTESAASPVGFRVADLPDFVVDPILKGSKGLLPCFNAKCEFVFGVLLALSVGAGVVFLSFTDWDEQLFAELGKLSSDVF